MTCVFCSFFGFSCLWVLVSVWRFGGELGFCCFFWRQFVWFLSRHFFLVSFFFSLLDFSTLFLEMIIYFFIFQIGLTFLFLGGGGEGRGGSHIFFFFFFYLIRIPEVSFNCN